MSHTSGYDLAILHLTCDDENAVLDSESFWTPETMSGMSRTIIYGPDFSVDLVSVKVLFEYEFPIRIRMSGRFKRCRHPVVCAAADYGDCD